MSACRSCGAAVVWGELAGKPHPFDEDGTSHFSTCPQADEWRTEHRRATQTIAKDRLQIPERQQDLFA